MGLVLNPPPIAAVAVWEPLPQLQRAHDSRKTVLLEQQSRGLQSCQSDDLASLAKLGGRQIAVILPEYLQHGLPLPLTTWR